MSDPHRERRQRIAHLVAAARDAGEPARGLCRACVDVAGVSGASAMVMNDGLPAPLCASDPVAARLEDLQHTLGEGPCMDAHALGRTVSEPDLATPRRPRWAAFAPAALAAGAEALFSFPLRIGAIRLGALTLWQDRPGELSADQDADGRAMAAVISNTILAVQSQAPAGALSPDLEVLASLRAQVHQAAGMVSVQLEVGVAEALARLRAYAYSSERSLIEVADDVVAGRLRLDE